jgi:Na+/H+ antiporter NhaD/arsenite permease-like protein
MEHAHPEVWSVIPFVVLLLMIATGPLFYPHFWEKHYPKVAAVLAAVVGAYYICVLHDVHHPIHAFAEYFSFISLLAALFVISGGIHIRVDKEGTPWVNTLLLIAGAVLANIIGTTGASMLLIRPFMRLNRDRIKVYHIVFFIFIVSNVGGSLTPIGDPPLFLGFLKGVPFQWTLLHIWPMWLFGVGSLAGIFYFYDKRNKTDFTPEMDRKYSGRITIRGKQNIIWLAVVIGAVFIDPNVIPLPSFLYISYDGASISYLRELIMLTAAIVAYKTSDKEALALNKFNFEPIKEVAFLFIGIFATMMPALQLIGEWAQANPALITEHSLYWMAGSLSGVLDNAPTYLNFLSAAMGKLGYSMDDKQQVLDFAMGRPLPESFRYLLAVSVSSVFFGACTYIGNAPNFMVKSIAEHSGIKMPSFTHYVLRYALPILIPVLVLTWLIFFVVL